MGSCCSSKQAVTGSNSNRSKPQPQKISVKSSKNKKKENNNEIHNALHSSITQCIPCIVQNDPSRVEFIRSLLKMPAADDLLIHFWIHKRGHLVRNWRKRYCVLEKNEVKYYKDAHHEPPYGKFLKGKVALFGAICVTSESEDFSTINIEIYGNQGEKDLFFYVENTEEGRECVDILQWSIRKQTLTMLTRTNKTAGQHHRQGSIVDELAGSTGGGGSGGGGLSSLKSEEMIAGMNWMDYQLEQCQQAIRYLHELPYIYEFIIIPENGSMIIRPGIMKLWHASSGYHQHHLMKSAGHTAAAASTAAASSSSSSPTNHHLNNQSKGGEEHSYDANFLPNANTESEQFGLAIHIWQTDEHELTIHPTTTAEQQLSGKAAGGGGGKEHNYSILTFADITDITYQYIDQASTHALRPQVNAFFHAKCSATDRPCSSTTSSGSTTTTGGRYLVVSIHSEFGHSYHLLTCCVKEDEPIRWIQNIMLYLHARDRLKKAGMQQSKEKQKNMLAVAAALQLVNQ